MLDGLFDLVKPVLDHRSTIDVVVPEDIDRQATAIRRRAKV